MLNDFVLTKLGVVKQNIWVDMGEMKEYACVVGKLMFSLKQRAHGEPLTFTLFMLFLFLCGSMHSAPLRR